MKKKIIVPVDFSAAAQNAYLYARDLAKELGATIELVHVYNAVTAKHYALPFDQRKNIKASMEKKLSNFANLPDLRENSQVMTKLEVNIQVIAGSVVKSIVALSKDLAVSIFVMGTTGYHNTLEKLFGSVSSSVAQQASCPVFLIPKDAKYMAFQNILYASNFESTNETTLNSIIKFANQFRASLHFVHVREPNEKEPFTNTEERIFQQLFKDGDPAFSFNMLSVKAKSVQSGLNQYAKENDIDLLVLVNNQRSFIDCILGKSMTKEMALHPHLPIMVHHLP